MFSKLQMTYISFGLSVQEMFVDLKFLIVKIVKLLCTYRYSKEINPWKVSFVTAVSSFLLRFLTKGKHLAMKIRSQLQRKTNNTTN